MSIIVSIRNFPCIAATCRSFFFFFFSLRFYVIFSGVDLVRILSRAI